MTTGSEQTVGERYVAHVVHQQFARTVSGFQTFVNLANHGAVKGCIGHWLTIKQVQGHIEELDVATSYAVGLAIAWRIVQECQHGVLHVARELCHQWQQLILLDLA